MENEFDLIDWIRAGAQGLDTGSDVVSAIGDDCALVRPGHGLLALTTDMLVEDVDFRREWSSPVFLGRKALAVNLSDLAAMGARPVCCLLALALPRREPSRFVRALVAGFLESARQYRCPLAGGDLSSAAKIQICVTALGRVGKGKPIGRAGAKPGDSILVAGRLGLSRTGLEILRASPPPGLNQASCRRDVDTLTADPFQRACLLAHLDPVPLLEVGAWAQQRGLANAMIDVSDGLSSDAWRIARESGTTAILDALELPQTGLGETMTLDAILNGGEDYALLLTASAKQVEGLRAEYPKEFPPLWKVGSIEKGGPALFLKDSSGLRKLEAKGFDHFR